jgi:hypothetical protein
MVFNATFNKFQLYHGGVLLVEETRVPRENHDLLQVIDKFTLILYQVHLA